MYIYLTLKRRFGYCDFIIQEEYIILDCIWIYKEYRSLKLGSLLLLQTIRLANILNKTLILTPVEIKTENSLSYTELYNWYKRYGFRESNLLGHSLCLIPD